MKVKVQSPGSGTVINAIATGYGSAFGLQLYVTAEVELNSFKSNRISCSADRDVDTELMEICAGKVIDRFRASHPIDDVGLKVKTSSTLPVASGLSSSSATSNAVVMATAEALISEYDVNPGDIGLKDTDLLNMGVDASLDAGVSVTGAFDDASASFFGGLTLTNNFERKILKMERLENQNIIVYMPNRMSPTAQADVGRMKLLAPQVKLAFNEALKGNTSKALTLNGVLYCASLGFNPNIALDALDAGASAAGLSGTGPSFVALVSDEYVENVMEAWSSRSGEIILTNVDNDGTRVISSG